VGVLGLADAAFWGLTPRLFLLLAECRSQVERRMDLRFGLVASVIYNQARGKARPLMPEDFFGHGAPVEKTREEMRQKIGELNAHLANLKEGSPHG
jgi:hypothetical protein